MLWDKTWNRKEEALPWFTLRKTERDHTSTKDVPEYCWVLSPSDDIAVTLGLKPSTVLFRDDCLRVFSALFADSALGHFAHNLDCNPGAMFPSLFFWSSGSATDSQKCIYSNGKCRDRYKICGPVYLYQLTNCREVNLSPDSACFAPFCLSSNILLVL